MKISGLILPLFLSITANATPAVEALNCTYRLPESKSELLLEVREDYYLISEQSKTWKHQIFKGRLTKRSVDSQNVASYAGDGLMLRVALAGVRYLPNTSFQIPVEGTGKLASLVSHPSLAHGEAKHITCVGLTTADIEAIQD